jgi:hypothetical protein
MLRPGKGPEAKRTPLLSDPSFFPSLPPTVLQEKSGLQGEGETIAF